MKKIILFFIAFIAISYSGKSLNNPSLRCLEVDTSGSVRVTWIHPTDLTNFNRYEIYYSTSLTAPFTLVHIYSPEPPNNIPDVNSIIHNGANANNTPVCYYYMAAVSNSGQKFYSDTLGTIEFYLTNPGDGTALLSWSPPVTPPLPTYSTNYYIHKRNPNNLFFSMVAIESGNHYNDIIDICNDYVQYKIELVDANANCQNISRIQSGLFTDLTAPETPILDSVSVNFNDDRVVLGWEESVSPDVTAYIIYFLENNLWIPIDTVFDGTTWTDSQHIADSSANLYYYRIGALDSCNNSSPMSEQQRTVQLNTSLNICAKELTLTWTEYENMKEGIGKYEIYYSENGGPLTFAGETNPTTRTFTFNNMTPNSYYCLVVKAVNQSGTIKASSAKSCLFFTNTETSDFAYIRYVSVENEEYIKIAIFTSGDTLPFKSVELLRSVGNENNFTPIALIPYNGTAHYQFEDRDANFKSEINYYKAIILSECDLALTESNISHNILLLGEANQSKINSLQWLNYSEWNGGVESYSLYRKVETETDFAQIVNGINPTNFNTYFDDVSELYGFGSEFGYYIEGREGMNEYGFNDISISNTVFLTQNPTTFVPNAFAPLSIHNNKFLPINSFVSPQSYVFEIFTRSGDLIFVTNDPYTGWDGKLKEKPLPEGVYVYKISYIFPDGKPYIKVGTVSLIK